MPQLVDRTMMESVFPPESLLRLDEEKLPVGLHESAHTFLTGIGLPDDRSSFFVIDGGLFEEGAPGGFRRCAELDFFSDYRDMPKGWENWLVIGEIFYDAVVLDPASGAVHCLPDGEYTARPLNLSLDSFGYFLYLLERERPGYDFTVSDDVTDSEGVAEALRERMIRADPLPFEGAQPAWSEECDQEAEDAPRRPTWDCVLAAVYESVG